jgi:ribosomal protein S18 acetylase RimI-like enzyme
MEEKTCTASIRIRPASSDEAELLASLNRDAFRDVAERFGLTPENCPQQAAFCTAETVLSDMAEGMTYYVLEYDDLPCGCVALGNRIPRVLYMKRLAVLPEHRRRGFGRMLVEWVIAEACRLGKARVEFGVFAHNTQLVRWYESLGFATRDICQTEEFPLPIAFMYAEVSQT